MVALLALHVLQVFVWGAYKSPRELVWVSGVFLLLTVLFFGFTGYLLPWDEKAYWATTVALELLDKFPLVGDEVARFLKGGATLGLLSLSRFFVIHAMLLPLIITALIALHVYLLRKAGPAGPFRDTREGWKAGSEHFYPAQVAKDLIFAAILLVGLGGVATFFPPDLLPKASAEPPSFNPQPEWYFLFYFQLLRLPLFAGEMGEFIGGIVLPVLFIGLLMGVPFIDRNPERDVKRRPVAMTLMALLLSGILTLTFMALLEEAG